MVTESGDIITSKILGNAQISHGFFTRSRDFSLEELEKMSSDDGISNKNLDFYLRYFNAPAIVLPRQVHKTRIWKINEKPVSPFYRGPEADGIISNLPDTAIGILTADCVPLLIASPNGKWVAAVHAGWKGLFSEIIPKAIKVFCGMADIEKSDIICAIGPAIGQCCFEVSKDLAEKFLIKYNWGKDYIAETDGDPHLDLKRIAKRQMMNIGINEKKIDLLDYCTKCMEDKFCSFRRDKQEAHRQISAIIPIEK